MRSAPEGAKKHPVRVGDEVHVKGTERVGPAARVIEATEVTSGRHERGLGRPLLRGRGRGLLPGVGEVHDER